MVSIPTYMGFTPLSEHTPSSANDVALKYAIKNREHEYSHTDSISKASYQYLENARLLNEGLEETINTFEDIKGCEVVDKRGNMVVEGCKGINKDDLTSTMRIVPVDDVDNLKKIDLIKEARRCNTTPETLLTLIVTGIDKVHRETLKGEENVYLPTTYLQETRNHPEAIAGARRIMYKLGYKGDAVRKFKFKCLKTNKVSKSLSECHSYVSPHRRRAFKQFHIVVRKDKMLKNGHDGECPIQRIKRKQHNQRRLNSARERMTKRNLSSVYYTKCNLKNVEGSKGLIEDAVGIKNYSLKNNIRQHNDHPTTNEVENVYINYIRGERWKNGKLRKYRVYVNEQRRKERVKQQDIFREKNFLRGERERKERARKNSQNN